MFSTIQGRNYRFTSDFDAFYFTECWHDEFVSNTYKYVPHHIDAKYQRKRNPEDLEQEGSKEKECAEDGMAQSLAQPDPLGAC